MDWLNRMLSAVPFLKEVGLPLLFFLATLWMTTGKNRSDASMARASQLDKNQSEWMMRIQEEGKYLRLRIDDLQIEMDKADDEISRWEAIARWWYRKAHELLHKMRGDRWKMQIEMQQAGLTTGTAWEPEPSIPAMVEAPEIILPERKNGT